MANHKSPHLVLGDWKRDNNMVYREVHGERALTVVINASEPSGFDPASQAQIVYGCLRACEAVPAEELASGILRAALDQLAKARSEITQLTNERDQLTREVREFARGLTEATEIGFSMESQLRTVINGIHEVAKQAGVSNSPNDRSASSALQLCSELRSHFKTSNSQSATADASDRPTNIRGEAGDSALGINWGHETRTEVVDFLEAYAMAEDAGINGIPNPNFSSAMRELAKAVRSEARTTGD